VTPDASQDLLQQLCADLRLLWMQAGGPTLRVLSGRVSLSKSQLGNILNGRIRQPPEWDVVRALVTTFARHARDRDRVAHVSMSTAIDEFWRPRHAVLEHAFRSAPRDTRSTPGRRPRWVSQHQLPGAVHHFAGRSHELETLSKLIDQGEGRAVVISAIDGTAGIGKTALAVHWAHAVADRFPDGQLYVNLRGFDPTAPPLTAAEAVRGFLEALAVRPEQIPASPEAQVGLYRTLLSGRRVLVVLDNARDADQVRPLLPANPEAMAVVTSRNRLTSLVATDGAHLITLDLLSPAQSHELLARRLGRERAAREPEAIEELIDQCARLPLALAIVAARAAAHPELPLAVLAGELRQADARLDALDAGDAATDVRNVFSWSYRSVGPEAARLFRLLGLHPGPTCSRAAAASLAGRPVGRELAELTRSHLLIEGPPGRYGFHDLLRVYAGELTRREDPAPMRQAARHRLLDHYVRTAVDAATLLNPVREPVTLAVAPPGAGSERLADRSAALAWFAAELPVLSGAVTLAIDEGFDEYACRLAWVVSAYLHLRGRWPERVAVLRSALVAAQRSGDRVWQARTHRDLTGAYAWLGRMDDSLVHSQRALDLYRELGDDAGRARTHRSICLLMERWGKLDQALEHARCSRDLFLGTDDRAGQAYAYNSVGWYHALVGSYEEAITECRQAITLLHDIGDRGGEATAWDSLGYAHHRLGHHDQAVPCYRRALDLLREVGDQYFEAPTLDHLGDTLYAVGDVAAARDAWRRALKILEELQPAEAAAVRAKLADAHPTPAVAADHLV
jgi:tetratricopeptide (TPR) repeat protein